MAEVELFQGIPVAFFEYMDKALVATLVPIALTVGAQVYKNHFDPAAQEQMERINQRPS